MPRSAPRPQNHADYQALRLIIMSMNGHLAGANEHDALRGTLEMATWLLDATADEVDHWFPDDPEPDVQGDMRRFAAIWRERFRLRHWREVVPEGTL
jgi:hypothetical protein